jgi:hypothetical protein
MANNKTEYGFGNDPIVIRSHFDDHKGGVALDDAGFPDEFVRAGHVIIRDAETKAIYKPMPVANGAYASLPQGYEYYGVLIASHKTGDAEKVSVLTIGEVNDKATVYPIAPIYTAFKAAVPTINWAHD